MAAIATIWNFQTAAFSFECIALPCSSLCLDFDDSGEVGDMIDDFSVVAFDAQVKVTHKDSGAVIGTAFLCDVILGDCGEFLEHPGFRELVRESVANARNTLDSLVVARISKLAA